MAPSINQVEDDLPSALDPPDMDWMNFDTDPEVSHNSAILPEWAFEATGASSGTNGLINNISPANQAFLLPVGDVSGTNAELSRTDATLDRRRDGSMSLTTEDACRESSGTTSTARSSYDTMGMGRFSTTSINTDHTFSSDTRIALHPTLGVALPEQKAYMCPKCNMGGGHFKRGYEWNIADTSGSTRNPSSARKNRGPKNTSGIIPQFPENKSQWVVAASFNAHIMEDHIDGFQRPNSEYVCCYCLCGSVGGNSNCLARFPDATSLVDHLRSNHAQGPRRLQHLQHYCDPIPATSYYSAVRE